MRCPIGVAGVITPWNFPFAIPSWKLMPALVAGNTAVFKPAGDTPEMAWHFTKIFEAAGLPPGVLNLVFGSGSQVGDPMVAHPGIQVLSFTGSTEVGLGIAGKGGALGKRISLEMGGKNAIIVLEDADLGLAADAIAWSAFGTTGQRCTACSRVLVAERVHTVVSQPRALRSSASTSTWRSGSRKERVSRPAGRAPTTERWPRDTSTAPPCSPASSPTHASRSRRSSGRCWP